jgi:GTP-binding protein YchF
MNLSIGIVGLPNVGKSTLFNVITNSSVEAANYPFATIEPNVGVIYVPDKRLYQLADLINPDKITPAICKFVDIAGLVKGASKGEGLGNQFLSNIREVDAICHVVRCFKDKQITHVYNEVDPIRDIEIINLELIMADLESMEKRYSKIVSKAKAGDKKYILEEKICNSIIHTLKQNKMVKTLSFNDEELSYVKQYNLLTSKPVFFVANIDEDHINNPQQNEHYLSLLKHANNEKVIPISINIEYEISKLPNDDKRSFMNDLNITELGMNNVVITAYDILGLQTFFTFGKQEVRA